jgi:hypothetical protein
MGSITPAPSAGRVPAVPLVVGRRPTGRPATRVRVPLTTAGAIGFAIAVAASVSVALDRRGRASAGSPVALTGAGLAVAVVTVIGPVAGVSAVAPTGADAGRRSPAPAVRIVVPVGADPATIASTVRRTELGAAVALAPAGPVGGPILRTFEPAGLRAAVAAFFTVGPAGLRATSAALLTVEPVGLRATSAALLTVGPAGLRAAVAAVLTVESVGLRAASAAVLTVEPVGLRAAVGALVTVETVRSTELAVLVVAGSTGVPVPLAAGAVEAIGVRTVAVSMRVPRFVAVPVVLAARVPAVTPAVGLAVVGRAGTVTPAGPRAVIVRAGRPAASLAVRGLGLGHVGGHLTQLLDLLGERTDLFGQIGDRPPLRLGTVAPGTVMPGTVAPGGLRLAIAVARLPPVGGPAATPHRPAGTAGPARAAGPVERRAGGVGSRGGLRRWRAPCGGQS